MKTYPQALTFSLKPQILSFHVVLLLTTGKEIDKNEKMHVQGVQSCCSCWLNMQICDVFVAVAALKLLKLFIYRGNQNPRGLSVEALVAFFRTSFSSVFI